MRNVLSWILAAYCCLGAVAVDVPSHSEESIIWEPIHLPKCEDCKMTRPLDEIRTANYGTITGYDFPVLDHYTAQPIPEAALRQTIMATTLLLPNIENSHELNDLLFETVVVGSRLGKWTVTVHEDYLFLGPTQIPARHASCTLTWLLFNRLDVYNDVIRFTQHQADLSIDVAYRVPVNIAVATEYYWLVCPDLQANILTPQQRAHLWAVAFAPAQLRDPEDYYLETLERYNQGWIDGRAETRFPEDRYKHK